MQPTSLTGKHGWWAMVDVNELSYSPTDGHPRLRCPHCATLSHLAHSLLDPCDGNTVNLYQCPECGKRIWEHVPALLVRSQ